MGPRGLSRLLVLMLCPVLIVTTRGVAEASTNYGPLAGPTLFSGRSTAAPVPGSSVKCNVSGYWGRQSTVLNVTLSVNCSTGWGVSWGDGSSWDSDLSVNGATSTGDVCSASFVKPTTLEGTWLQTSSVSAGGADPVTCHVTQVCWGLWSTWGVDHTVWDVCQGLDLGPTTGPTGTCTHGTPTVPTLGVKFNSGIGDQRQYYTTHMPNFTAGGDGNWWVVSVMNPGGSGWKTLASGIVLGRFNGVQQRPYSADAVSNAEIVGPENGSGAIIGISMIYSPGGVDGRIHYLPQENAGVGKIGVTDPGDCVFYWGPKIASITGSDADEPLGVLVGVPAAPDSTVAAPGTPDDTGCGFSVGNPSSWAAGGICELVHAVGALGGLIGDLIDAVAGLVEAILHMLQDLFIPNPDSWDVDGLKAQLDAKPPFSVVGSMTSSVQAMAGSYSGSCSGDLYALEIQDGTTTSVMPCGGPPYAGWGALMALVRTILLITTGLVIWNIFTEAIGPKG